LQDLFEQLFSAATNSDHPDARAIVGAQDAWRRVGCKSGGANCRLFDEFTA
jgi:hypothetical protein